MPENRNRKSGEKQKPSQGVNRGQAKRTGDQPPGAAKHRRFPVVCIGASAGGLEPIQSFFEHIPTDPGMAFVVVTHMDPRHGSLMPELIQTRTSMPVLQVKGGTAVEPDHVYVIPPDRDMSISRGVLQLASPAPQTHGPYLPINTFLRSLSEDMKEYGIAVILSGMGTDGTLGVKAIKSEMGMVMVQDPETAEYSSMPVSAIQTGLADYILPPAQMAEYLMEYVKRFLIKGGAKPLVPERVPASDMERIYTQLRTLTGNDFSHYKESTILRRISRRMFVHHIDSIRAYSAFIEKNPYEAKALFKEFLIGVTSFFRDPESFESLKKALLESLQHKPSESSLRAWVVGCSTGEEAYSVAIVLDECREELGLSLDVKIFATDVDEEAIEKARIGLYPLSIAEDMSEGRLNRYFEREDDSYRIKRSIRDMMIFADHSVIRDAPFTKLDLISCRNLLIYLDAELQKKIIPLFHYSLNPGGILFLGSSETIGAFSDIFSTLDLKWKIYRRGENHAYNYPMIEFPLGSARRLGEVQKAARPRPVELSAVIERNLLENHTPAAIVVDRKGDILYIHGRTGMYLEPAPGVARVYNAFEMARDGLRNQLPGMVRSAVENKDKVFTRKLKIRTNGQYALVNVIVKALNEPVGELYMVLFVETPQEAAREEGGPVKLDKVRGRDRELISLREELQYVKDHLRTTIEELEAANEELKSTNEEYQSTNEELQSSNEELNSSKEELQSLNEELETVNRELQSKIQEAQNAYGEINRFINNINIPMLFLDSGMRIKRYNVSVTRIVNLIEADIGRPVNQITSTLKDVDIFQEGMEVIRTLREKRKEVQSQDGNVYEMQISPSRTTDNRIDGVTVIFIPRTGGPG
jgi:two-component system CheB/CheR fusion protein